MEEIGIPELNEDQMQTLSEIAEKSAREFITSKIPKKKISTLEIIAEIAGAKPITVSVNIDLKMLPSIKTCNTEKLANDAVEKALEAVEQYLRELSCKSKT